MSQRIARKVCAKSLRYSTNRISAEKNAFSVTPAAAGSYAFQSYARVMYSSTNSTASGSLTAQ